LEKDVVGVGNFCGIVEGRESGGRGGWVDLEVLVTLFEGCKEGRKAVANREVAIVVSKLNFLITFEGLDRFV
jgi:hypothetical protein